MRDEYMEYILRKKILNSLKNDVLFQKIKISPKIIQTKEKNSTPQPNYFWNENDWSGI